MLFLPSVIAMSCNTNCARYSNVLMLNFSMCRTVKNTFQVHTLVYNYNISGVTLAICHATKDLGVTFDVKFTFNAHVDKIIADATKMLGFIARKSRHFKRKVVLLILFFSFVSSKQEYVSLIFDPIYEYQIHAFECV